MSLIDLEMISAFRPSSLDRIRNMILGTGAATMKSRNRFSTILLFAAWLVYAAMLFAFASPALAQNKPIHVIAFGAHPDDCDLGAGGIASKYAILGHKVKFVSLTNGDVGHQSQHGQELAKRRRDEAQEAGRRIGIEYEVLDNHDGNLLPTLEIREQVIQEIRQWKADIVIAPRPNDYHPDHRYTGVLVQDASYMVIVPHLVPDTAPLTRNPVFLYYSDRFTQPQPFRPDIVVSIDDVFDKKINMLDAHVSQFYEWLPWTEGVLDQVPKDRAARKKWLAEWPHAARKLQPEWREALEKRYAAQAATIQHAEAFEITEYGRQPSEEEIRVLLPFFPPNPSR
jgi:LmbE family N-acetylglucosaminyl deacetylase